MKGGHVKQRNNMVRVIRVDKLGILYRCKGLSFSEAKSSRR